MRPRGFDPLGITIGSALSKEMAWKRQDELKFLLATFFTNGEKRQIDDDLFAETINSPNTRVFLHAIHFDRAGCKPEPIGMFLGTVKPAFLNRVLYVDSVVVAPEYRGKGCAEKVLVPAMVEMAGKEHCSQIDLTTSNEVAGRAYERAGFNKTATTAYRLKL